MNSNYWSVGFTSTTVGSAAHKSSLKKLATKGWGYVACVLERYMVQTLSAHVAFRPEAKVTHLCLAGDESFLVWAEKGGRVSIGTFTDDASKNTSIHWKGQSTVVGLCSRADRLFVLDDMTGLTCLDSDAHVAWSIEIPGGGFSLHQGPKNMAVVDALGRLHVIGYDGKKVDMFPPIEGVLRALYVGQFLAIAHEDGTVHVLKDGQVTWRRPSRGEVGESITVLGSHNDEHLIIGREGYALVDGDEEALEMEVWDLHRNTLIQRSDLKTRLTHCQSNGGILFCGFDDGLVTKYADGVHEEVMRTNYAVQNLTVSGNQLIISSWFYLFGSHTDGTFWKMEHQGMPSLVVASNKGRVCFFAGEDQNDWTDAEPIGSFSLLDDYIDVDPSELSEWFQKASSEPQRSAEEIYRIDESVNELLTEDERNMQGTALDDSIESLQDALGDLSEELDDQVPGTLNIDASSLLEALDDELSNMAMMPDEDLFDALNETISAPISPVPKAGDDRTITCEDDGTAVVVLDGLGSEDVQNRIVMWSWVDSTGKEISSKPQVKVRLDAGVHRFELRICDSEGQWSSDSIQLTLNKA